MNKNGLRYAPPKTTIYRFDNTDRILTESGNPDVSIPTPEYAANALNEFMGGVNTTIE